MKISEASIALFALAQESRLEVFRLLAKNSPDGLCAGDLSRALDIPKPTLSFHLKELSTAGLIDSEKNGRSIKYRLQDKRMSQLLTFLTEDCCQGRPELCCPKKPTIS